MPICKYKLVSWVHKIEHLTYLLPSFLPLPLTLSHPPQTMVALRRKRKTRRLRMLEVRHLLPHSRGREEERQRSGGRRGKRKEKEGFCLIK